MKQLPKETELEKFSLFTHAALLLKPKENKQNQHFIARPESVALTQLAFPLPQKMSSTRSTVAETKKLSQNKEVVELRPSETTSPDRHLAGDRSQSVSNGAD